MVKVIKLYMHITNSTNLQGEPARYIQLGLAWFTSC